MAFEHQSVGQERLADPLRGIVNRRIRALAVVSAFLALAACAGYQAPLAGADPLGPARLLVGDVTDGQMIAELEGRSLAGIVNIVVEAPATVSAVGFHLNAEPEPLAVARSRPLVFALDTTTLSDGEHRIAAARLREPGDVLEVLAEASFSVANAAVPTDPPPGDDEPTNPPPSNDDPSDPPPGDDDPSDPPPGDSGGVLGSVVGVVHAPFVEWRVEVGEVAGVSAWDVRAFATFTRRDGGEVWRVPWFYAGDGVFALRFTGPRTGVYDVLSSSAEVPGLDGLAGLVTIEANPAVDAKGFLTSVGNAFAYLVGDGSVARRTLYNVYQRHPNASRPVGLEVISDLYGERVSSRGERIEALLDEARDHGMQAIFVMVHHNWVRWPVGWDEAAPVGSDAPDPATFVVLEDLLERARARGMFVHIWKWADEDRNQTAASLDGGINGFVDERVQYYIAGRLGAYPNWSMSYGFDLEEWVTPAQVRAWHANMTTWNTLPRVYMARELGRHAGVTFELADDKLEVFSNDLRPTSGFYADARALFEATGERLPVMYERRFLHTRDGVWDMTTTRRAIWQFTLAGGAAGIYGVLWGPGPEYPNPEQLVSLARFWEQRFEFPLQPLASPADGLVTRDGEARQVVYKESTRSITIVIPAGMTNQPVIAVDTRAAYSELDLGNRDAGTHTISLPSRSDWAIAIGDFTRP